MELVPQLCCNGFRFLTCPTGSKIFPSFFLLLEFFIGTYIIRNIAYTEIDWIAYMQQVEAFINGTRDYDKLVGQTGPCVYPAGHIYIYSFLYIISSGGKDILRIQFLFLSVYLLSLACVFNILRKIKKVPVFALIVMCVTSYRIHSIYLLRLFNDPLAMLFLYICVNMCLYCKFSCAAFFFSLAVSVKMNILLFAPGFLLVLLLHRGVFETIGHLAECAIIQLLLGAAFLFRNSEAYFGNAFEFSRQFMYKWTVNWKVIPEELFLDRRFHVLLLVFHILLITFFLISFVRSCGGFRRLLRLLPPAMGKQNIVVPEDVVYPLFVANFIGIAFSRSLHYQFYVWYYHTIPYLLWSIPFYSNRFRLLIWGLIEMSWNIYPSTMWSSAILHASHFAVLIGLIGTTITSKGIERQQQSEGDSRQWKVMGRMPKKSKRH